MLQGGVTGVRAPLDAAAKIADRPMAMRPCSPTSSARSSARKQGEYTSAALFRSATPRRSQARRPHRTPRERDGAVQAMLDAAISKPPPPATQQFVVSISSPPGRASSATPSRAATRTPRTSCTQSARCRPTPTCGRAPTSRSHSSTTRSTSATSRRPITCSAQAFATFRSKAAPPRRRQRSATTHCCSS